MYILRRIKICNKRNFTILVFFILVVVNFNNSDNIFWIIIKYVKGDIFITYEDFPNIGQLLQIVITSYLSLLLVKTTRESNRISNTSNDINQQLLRLQNDIINMEKHNNRMSEIDLLINRIEAYKEKVRINVGLELKDFDIYSFDDNMKRTQAININLVNIDMSESMYEEIIRTSPQSEKELSEIKKAYHHMKEELEKNENFGFAELDLMKNKYSSINSNLGKIIDSIYFIKHLIADEYLNNN